MYKHRVEQAFCETGLRRTPQRYCVLEHLVRHPAHATAEEIFKAVNRRDPRASRATVYNSLHALTRAGLVREVLLEGNATRFDANLDRHHHFVCDRCGRIEDIEWFDVPRISAGSPLGSRTVRDYELILRGVCEVCA